MNGNDLRRLREKTGKTQADFAKFLRAKIPGAKVHEIAVARWESGARKISAMTAVALKKVVEDNT